MRILNKNEAKLCTERFDQMITRDLDVSEIFRALDSTLYEYVDYIIGNGDACPTKEQGDNLFYLKKLRDLFIDDTKDV